MTFRFDAGDAYAVDYESWLGLQTAYDLAQARDHVRSINVRSFRAA